MNLNLGNYENVKTYADEEFNLDTLCKEGTTFDLRVMEKESDGVLLFLQVSLIMTHPRPNRSFQFTENYFIIFPIH